MNQYQKDTPETEIHRVISMMGLDLVIDLHDAEGEPRPMARLDHSPADVITFDADHLAELAAIATRASRYCACSARRLEYPGACCICRQHDDYEHDGMSLACGSCGGYGDPCSWASAHGLCPCITCAGERAHDARAEVESRPERVVLIDYQRDEEVEG